MLGFDYQVSVLSKSVCICRRPHMKHNLLTELRIALFHRKPLATCNLSMSQALKISYRNSTISSTRHNLRNRYTSKHFTFNKYAKTSWETSIMLRNNFTRLNQFLTLVLSIRQQSQRSPHHLSSLKSITACSVKNQELVKQGHLVGKDQISFPLISDTFLKSIHMLEVETGSLRCKEILLASKDADAGTCTRRKCSTATIWTQLYERRLVLKLEEIRDFHKQVEVTVFKRDRSWSMKTIRLGIAKWAPSRLPSKTLLSRLCLKISRRAIRGKTQATTSLLKSMSSTTSINKLISLSTRRRRNSSYNARGSSFKANLLAKQTRVYRCISHHSYRLTLFDRIVSMKGIKCQRWSAPRFEYAT